MITNGQMKKNQKANIIATSSVGLLITFIVMAIVAPKLTLLFFFVLITIVMAGVGVALFALLWLMIYDTFRDRSEEPNQFYNFLTRIFR